MMTAKRKIPACWALSLSVLLAVGLLVNQSQAFTVPRRLSHSRFITSQLTTGAIPPEKNQTPEPSGSTSISNVASKETTTTEIDNNMESLGKRLWEEVQELSTCLSIVLSSLWQSDDNDNDEAMVNTIVTVCDQLDQLETNQDLFVSNQLAARQRALQFKRYQLLINLLRHDYKAYVATASFLSPSRIPRNQLPNIQDVLYDKDADPVKQQQQQVTSQQDEPLVADCQLQNMTYQDSILDKILLSIFRKLVATNTGGVTSDQKGIDGLVEQGRTFMLQPGQTPEAQHQMVYDTLGGLMTPALPPFYRIFMAGIVPKLGTDLDGKQFGPWFYAPWLTALVTPLFFGFLVGPSHPNRRKNGKVGGLLVEKCKFLQQSGCKGLCLHQCKMPAQQFFAQELGLSLTVTPNFETQECQWSFGETPVENDPSFPRGCLVGCESRKAMAGRYADVCN